MGDTDGLRATNPKHQKALERAYRYIRTYHEWTNQAGELGEDTKAGKKLLKGAESAFECFQEVCADLPKREQANLQRFHKAQHGYEA